jgi:hypothetical protein
MVFPLADFGDLVAAFEIMVNTPSIAGAHPR